ncbi:restriction endonuclease subunit S [Vibrio tarriae]|uniref:restriction endonuclease subunit S n=1 Tax=Vibrio tarriae TaxID=2014742 RepID=UPI001C66D3B1|nr:restriction endonuclease subunit S [Vibrio tarriae]
MSKQKKRLVPELRFAEFEYDAPWTNRPLASVLNEHGLKSTGKEVVFSVSVHKGLINQVEHLGRSFSASNTDNYNRVIPGDIVYTKSPTGDFPLGIIKQSKVDSPVIVSPLYGVFSPETKGLGALLDAYFETPANTKLYLDPLVQKGAKNTINVTNKKFLSGSLPLPTSKAEQEKLGFFIDSVDELITLHTQKLNALKDHKKGLMQQLFPAEGETVPKLRFPEFQGEGEWVKKPLKGVIEIASGQVDPTKPPYCDMPHIGGENIESDSGKILNVSTAKDLNLISGKYVFDESYILYSKIRPALNKVASPNFKGICSADIYPIRPATDELLKGFLFYLLLSKEFLDYAKKHSDRGKIPKVNREALMAYIASLPAPDEQRQIAEFLCSIDDLLASQTRKVEALRAHKNGLMQKLFPVVDEVV